jgi:hypothetical protein
MGGTCGFRLSFFVGGLGAVFEEKECRDLRVWEGTYNQKNKEMCNIFYGVCV